MERSQLQSCIVLVRMNHEMEKEIFVEASNGSSSMMARWPQLCVALPKSFSSTLHFAPN